MIMMIITIIVIHIQLAMKLMMTAAPGRPCPTTSNHIVSNIR